MESIDTYIPKEYLALKINYCRKRLQELPVVKIYHYRQDDLFKRRAVVDGHKYDVDSPLGRGFYEIWQERDELERQLNCYEATWYCHFNGEPLQECVPNEVKRYLRVSYDQEVVMNKTFFDSLKNDDNTRHEKYKNNFFNGIYYRSAAERDIAIYYYRNGIPFKYEPSITLFGIPKPINPDFVLYIRELNTCKIHEHLGMKESSDYLRNVKTKYGNYSNSGLVPGMDVLFTYDRDDLPFDIRCLAPVLNSAVYGTVVCGNCGKQQFAV